MRLRIQIVAVVLLLLVAMPLFAQKPVTDRSSHRRDRDRDEELDAKRRIEADLRQAQFSSNRFYLLSRFELGDIGIGIGADDLYLPADEAIDGLALAMRAPQRLYYIANRRTLFSIDAEPGYVLYIDSDRENRLSWLLRGDVHLLFPFFYVNGFATVSDQLVRETTELDRLTPRDTQSRGINTEIKPSSRTSMKFSFVESDIDYDPSESLFYDPRLNLLERTTQQYIAEGRHHTFPITHTLVGARRTDFEFPLATDRDSTETFVYVGADREFSTYQIVARVGHGELDYADSDAQDFDGILGDARLNLVIDSRHSMSLAYQRELEFSIAQNGRHYLADKLTFSDQRDLTSRLRTHLQAFGSLHDYPVALDTPAGPVEREDELYFVGAGASYKFFDWLRLGVLLGPWERNSNISGESADGIRWQILLSFN